MKRTTLALLLAPLFSTAVMAQSYNGPSANVQVTTVAEALKAADDTQVVLQGQIVERLRGEHYTFKDATGTVEVEIDDEDWPSQSVDDKATVKLTGEVDQGRSGVEVEVDRVELVK
ncbi:MULTISPECIES: NirD/YgiW/YdeI family stress tolerance protein [Pseudomonas]|uniref:TIGR00156 family protein n=1 Tax=Pseudomonas segetis TaxID=298908 RepID=A0A239II85_9PSED|nr:MULTISPECIES: NirD/YgiW/YdeI family stress tolerance protein [Pseudomonas]SNS93275.1 TIGR00156 family protein [Pseudomonas segetis]